MGKKKIVVDTNNFISALGWNGKSKELFQKIINGEYNLFISIQQIAELRKVMEYQKFSFTEEQKRKFLEILFEVATIIETKTKIDVIKEDTDDNILLECASEAGADCIISGDNHLKKLKEFGKIKIVSVSEFLEME